MAPTVPTYITAEVGKITPGRLVDLAKRIKADAASSKASYQVVDVRDDDFLGGNIPSCHRLPSASATLDHFDELTTQLKDKDTVVFHCTLSQVRGPKAARKYAEALSRKDPSSTQKVLILSEGFSGFQAKYRNDPVLVEKFIKSAWD